MWLVDKLAEARIEEAMQAGQFDDLPGYGEPVQVEPPGMVPAELRVGYRLLKNAGYVPPEVTLLREIHEVEQLMAGLDDGESRSGAVKRLNLLRAQLGARAESLNLSREYSTRIMNKLGREPS